MNSVVCVMASYRSQVVEVLVDLPVRDPRAMALDLEPLDGQEGVDDLRAHRVAQDGVGLQGVEGLLQRAGQRGADDLRRRPVGVAGDGRGRLEALADAVRAGREDG